MTQTRTDVRYTIPTAAQTTELSFDQKSIEKHNNTVLYLRETRNIASISPRLNPKRLIIACYTDAGQMNTATGKCQIGYIFLLAVDTNQYAKS